MDTKTIEQLSVIRENLSKGFKFFPLDCCWISSQKVKETLGEIIDITARQFDERLPDVYVLDGNSQEAQSHYLEGVCGC